MQANIEPKDIVKSAWAISGLSQAKFAESIKKSQAMLSKYISGKVPPPASVLIHCMNKCGMLGAKVISANDLANRVAKELEGEEFSDARAAINQIIDSISAHNKPSAADL